MPAQLAHLNRTLRMLSAANHALIHATEEQALLDEVCRIVVELGGFQFAWIGYAEQDASRSVRPRAQHGPWQRDFGVLAPTWADEVRGRGPTGTAIRSGAYCYIADLRSDARFAPWREAAMAQGCASVIALPLEFESGIGGALTIFAAGPGAFDQHDLDLVRGMAADLSFGIRMLRLGLRHQATLAELRALNAGLEQRIEERTAELAANARELERANMLKSQFLASMSHELRTPLNAIIGFSDVLKDGLAGDLNDRQREFAHDIHSSGRHLLSLVNDILDLSKIDAGAMSLNREALDVTALLNDSLSVVRERALARGLRLEVEIEANLPALNADARKVKQIAYNLLANAVKFTPAQGRVRLGARRVARAAVAPPAGMPGRLVAPPPGDDAQFVELSVRDDGIGIAEADLARLFQPFVQIDGKLTREFHGTGLGLSMVSKLAELHGGTAGVSSAPGRGSTFLVWLPVGKAVRPPAREPLALVIEQDDSAARMLELALWEEGFRTIRAATGEEALVRAGKDSPQLITLEILLPNMDGWTVIERLRAKAELAAIPVLVVTAASLGARERAALDRGALHVLAKQEFDSEQFIAEVRRVTRAQAVPRPAKT